MTELSGPTFSFIKLMYEAGEKADKKWATEMMMKLYAKAVPQAGDDANNPIFTAQITGMEIIDASQKDPIREQEPEANTGSEVLAG
jgi:hypothetical protein